MYLDDVLIHSKDNQSNLAAMEVAFQRLRRFGLRLNPAKCEFAVEKIPYLGFTLSKDGVTPGEDKLRAIREFPAPDTITKLREFAGVCNYFRHMVKGYALLSGRLTWLLTKDSNWKGGEMPR